jgi:hypothetical protein
MTFDFSVLRFRRKSNGIKIMSSYFCRPPYCEEKISLFTPKSIQRTKKSKWFEHINFVVTHFTSYFNERSKNFTHNDCEDHFYPKDSPSTTEVDYSALKLIEFGGLLSICTVVICVSLLALVGEIAFTQLSRRQILDNPFESIYPMTKTIRFTYESACVDYIKAIVKCDELRRQVETEHCQVIIDVRVKTNSCYTHTFDISISFVLSLNVIDESFIVQQLQALRADLDSISGI